MSASAGHDAPSTNDRVSLDDAATARRVARWLLRAARREEEAIAIPLADIAEQLLDRADAL